MPKTSTAFYQKPVLLFAKNQYWFLRLSTEHPDVSTIGNNIVIVNIANLMLNIGGLTKIIFQVSYPPVRPGICLI
jgi:hypothetical protein